VNLHNALNLMSFLSKDLNREILKSLIRSPKDMRSLCRDIHKKRSTVFDSIKEMESVGVIQSKKVKTPGRGRNRKEYSVKEFYVPEITRETLLDFLEGKDVQAKSMDSGDMALIGSFSQVSPVTPERICNLLLSSGVDLKYVFQILLDLASRFLLHESSDTLQIELEHLPEAVPNMWHKIAVIMEDRYPIRPEVVEKFLEMSEDEIVLTSLSESKKVSISDLTRKIRNELNITEYEAEFIAPAVLHMLKSNGFNEISDVVMVDLMYLLAKNMKIDCEKPRSYVEGQVVGEFTAHENILVREGTKTRKWDISRTSDFILKRFELNRESSRFLASLILDKLEYIGLGSYDISFIESLTQELIHHYRI
jgi:predicted transcriptional regulator